MNNNMKFSSTNADSYTDYNDKPDFDSLDPVHKAVVTGTCKEFFKNITNQNYQDLIAEAYGGFQLVNHKVRVAFTNACSEVFDTHMANTETVQSLTKNKLLDRLQDVKPALPFTSPEYINTLMELYKGYKFNYIPPFFYYRLKPYAEVNRLKVPLFLIDLQTQANNMWILFKAKGVLIDLHFYDSALYYLGKTESRSLDKGGEQDGCFFEEVPLKTKFVILELIRYTSIEFIGFCKSSYELRTFNARIYTQLDLLNNIPHYNTLLYSSYMGLTLKLPVKTSISFQHVRDRDRDREQLDVEREREGDLGWNDSSEQSKNEAIESLMDLQTQTRNTNNPNAKKEKEKDKDKDINPRERSHSSKSQLNANEDKEDRRLLFKAKHLKYLHDSGEYPTEQEFQPFCIHIQPEPLRNYAYMLYFQREFRNEHAQLQYVIKDYDRTKSFQDHTFALSLLPDSFYTFKDNDLLLMFSEQAQISRILVDKYIPHVKTMALISVPLEVKDAFLGAKTFKELTPLNLLRLTSAQPSFWSNYYRDLIAVHTAASYIITDSYLNLYSNVKNLTITNMLYNNYKTLFSVNLDLFFEQNNHYKNYIKTLYIEYNECTNFHQSKKKDVDQYKFLKFVNRQADHTRRTVRGGLSGTAMDSPYKSLNYLVGNNSHNDERDKDTDLFLHLDLDNTEVHNGNSQAPIGTHTPVNRPKMEAYISLNSYLPLLYLTFLEAIIQKYKDLDSYFSDYSLWFRQNINLRNKYDNNVSTYYMNKFNSMPIFYKFIVYKFFQNLKHYEVDFYETTDSYAWYLLWQDAYVVVTSSNNYLYPLPIVFSIRDFKAQYPGELEANLSELRRYIMAFIEPANLDLMNHYLRVEFKNDVVHNTYFVALDYSYELRKSINAFFIEYSLEHTDSLKLYMMKNCFYTENLHEFNQLCLLRFVVCSTPIEISESIFKEQSQNIFYGNHFNDKTVVTQQQAWKTLGNYHNKILVTFKSANRPIDIRELLHALYYNRERKQIFEFNLNKDFINYIYNVHLLSLIYLYSVYYFVNTVVYIMTMVTAIGCFTSASEGANATPADSHTSVCTHDLHVLAVFNFIFQLVYIMHMGATIFTYVKFNSSLLDPSQSYWRLLSHSVDFLKIYFGNFVFNEKLIEQLRICVCFYCSIVVWSKVTAQDWQVTDSDILVIGLSCNLIVLNVLNYLKKLHGTMRTVIIFLEIVKDLKYIFFIVLAIVVAVTVNFYVISLWLDGSASSTLAGGSQPTFMDLFGLAVMYCLTQDTAIYERIGYPGSVYAYRVFKECMEVGVVLAMALVLLNFVIAAMGDSYNKVVDNINLFQYKSKLETCMEFHFFLELKYHCLMAETEQTILPWKLELFDKSPQFDDWLGTLDNLKNHIDGRLKPIYKKIDDLHLLHKKQNHSINNPNY